MEKIKASQRNGRAGRLGAYNSNHNTLEETRAQEGHIDHSRTHLNEYAFFDKDGEMHFSGSFNSKDHECDLYSYFYKDGLDAKNERYIQQRHPERCRDIKDILNDEKLAPFEMLFQIGKEGYRCESPETLKEITQQVVAHLQEKYGNNFKLLDMAVHRDETTDHVHLRGTFCARDKYGHLLPNQSQALKEMGHERPDLTKPRSRYNNALMSFTDELRAYFYDRCEERGIQIDREPAGPSQRHKDTLEHKVEQLDAEIAAKDAIIAEKDARIASLENVIKQQQKDIAQLGQGVQFLTAADNAINRAASTLSNDKSAQIREELPAEMKGIGPFKKEVKPEGVRVDLDVWNETAQAARGKATAAALQSVSAQLVKYMNEAAFLVDGVAMRNEIQELQKQIKEIAEQYQQELEKEQRRSGYACDMLQERGVDSFTLECELRLRERVHNCMAQCERYERPLNDIIIEAHSLGDFDLVRKLLDEKRKLPKGKYSIKEMLEKIKEDGLFAGMVNYAKQRKQLQEIEKLHDEIDSVVYGRVSWKIQNMMNDLAKILDAQKAAGGPLLISQLQQNTAQNYGHSIEHNKTRER